MKIKNNINSMLDIPPQYWNTIGGGADTEDKKTKPEIIFDVKPTNNGVKGTVDAVVPLTENISIGIHGEADTNKHYRTDFEATFTF